MKHFALDKSSRAYFLYEYAGIPGTLLCGWMSDKVFRGNRGATGVFFMTLVTIATIVYWMNPAGNPNVDMACMIIIGFLIYGPVMLIGLHALELAPKKRRERRLALPVCSVISVVLWPRAPLLATPLTSSVGTAALW